MNDTDTGSGIVGINEGNHLDRGRAFGGMKESSIGREGSKYNIDEFVEIKYLCMSSIRETPWLALFEGVRGEQKSKAPPGEDGEERRRPPARG